MGTAAILAARTGNPSDHANKRFRTFIFMFANTFFHEMAHMLVTFLTQDLTLTPPNIGPRISGYSNGGIGEAGRYLETTVFGGTLEYYRDHSDDGGQVLLMICLCSSTPIVLICELMYVLARHPSYPHKRRCPTNLAALN